MKNKRNGSIDFWKFMFSVLIVVFHGKNLAEAGEWKFLGGSIGVEFFFIVSGILMANSSIKVREQELSLGQDTFQFMKRKVLGIMPNIYVAWIIAFLVEHIGNFSIGKMVKDAITSVWELLFVTETGLMGYRANAVCWYISAMLIAMLILYPLMKKYKDTFFYIIAPLIVIFVMGITYQQWNNLRVPHAWNGWAFKSLIRAVMGITIGCLCYKISVYIRGMKYTKLSEVFWTVAEWGGYGVVMAYSYGHGGTKKDWLLVLLLAVSVICSFSQVSITDRFFSNHKIFNWLGEFSFSLYLGHGYWSHKISLLFPNLNYYQRMPIYIVISVITGLFIMYISKGLKSWWRESGSKWKAYFILNER